MTSLILYVLWALAHLKFSVYFTFFEYIFFSKPWGFPWLLLKMRLAPNFVNKPRDSDSSARNFLEQTGLLRAREHCMGLCMHGRSKEAPFFIRIICQKFYSGELRNNWNSKKSKKQTMKVYAVFFFIYIFIYEFTSF